MTGWGIFINFLTWHIVKSLMHKQREKERERLPGLTEETIKAITIRDRTKDFATAIGEK